MVMGRLNPNEISDEGLGLNQFLGPAAYIVFTGINLVSILSRWWWPWPSSLIF